MAPDAELLDSASAPVAAPEPASAPAEPASAPSPAPAPAAAAPASESTAPAAASSSLEAAVLGLEATGLAKLDQPLPEGEVVRVGEAPAAAAPAAAPAEPKPEDASGEEAELPDPTEAELAAAPKGLRRRFQQVRNQNARLKEQVATVQPAAQQYEKLQSFLASNHLDARSAANALRIAALLQGANEGRVDPAGVIEELMPLVDQLKSLSGDVLPDDVKKRLDEGVIDDDTAKELAQRRAREVLTQRRASTETRELNTQLQQTKAQQIYAAVQAWESAVRARDPDFAKKAKLVATTADSLRMKRYGVNGMPPSVEQAHALAQEAYDLVTREMAAALPQPAAVRAPLNGATSPKSTMRAEPKTSLEAAIQGLERMAT